MTALRLAQGRILEARIQQLAEAWMIGTGIQITQHNGDVALLLSGRQLPQTDDAGGPSLHPRIGDFGCAETNVMPRIESIGKHTPGTSAAGITAVTGDMSLGSIRIHTPLNPPLSVPLLSPN